MDCASPEGPLLDLLLCASYISMLQVSVRLYPAVNTSLRTFLLHFIPRVERQYEKEEFEAMHTDENSKS
jgi:hypothetical protein